MSKHKAAPGKNCFWCVNCFEQLGCKEFISIKLSQGLPGCIGTGRPYIYIEDKEVTKQHKHAELIKAWADGAIIQFKNPSTDEWEDVIFNKPIWGYLEVYRVKPEEVKPAMLYQALYKCYVDSKYQVSSALFASDKEAAEYLGDEFIRLLPHTGVEV